MHIKNDAKIKALTFPINAGKHTAGEGLVLLVNKSGKYWQYPYKFEGRRKQASLGVYAPTKDKHVTLKAAREAMHEVKKLIRAGIDPNEQAKQKRFDNKQKTEMQKEARQATRQKKAEDKNTFKVVATGWHSVQSTGWVDSHANTVINTLRNHIFPSIGETPVLSLTKREAVAPIESLIEAGKIPTAKKTGQIIREVLEYAYDKDLIPAVPMGNLKRLFPAYKAKPMHAITDPKELGGLMRAMHGYTGDAVTCLALQIIPHVFLRSGEFRAARWIDIDLGGAIWTIPAADRKQRKAAKEDISNTHVVPLSRQVLAMLEQLLFISGESNGGYLFPNRSGEGVMSENTINRALHRLGYKGKQVGHGFRACFNTLMEEKGFIQKALDRQLAHVEENKVRGAYARSEFEEERVTIMQHWSDYLDGLRDGAQVIPIATRRA